jgi:hypothetical protein
MKGFFGIIFLAAAVLTFPGNAFSQPPETVEQTKRIVAEIVEESFPELRRTNIEIKTFRSASNFYKSQFSIARFLTFRKLGYVILVNPEVYRLAAPADGIRAILAHELAHLLYYKRKTRFQLLGLARLAGRDFTSDFERKADLETIARGYGEGLKAYRKWLYENIPAKEIEAKKRNYFAPDEIDSILRILRDKPEMLGVWRKRAPRNRQEIRGEKR